MSNSNKQLPTVTEAKALAKRFRDEHKNSLSNSAALEHVAEQYGFRDWNTFSAAIADRTPDGWEVGGRVSGKYLSHPFNATVHSIKLLRPGWFHMTLNLDEAIDVIRSESLSNFRKRIQGVVGPAGTSQEKTSDGVPQLQINI